MHRLLSPSPVPRTCDGVLAERWMPRPHRGRMPQHLRGETCTSRCICIGRRGSSSLQTRSRWTKTLSGTCITWRKGTSTPAFAYLMGHGPMETCKQGLAGRADRAHCHRGGVCKPGPVAGSLRGPISKPEPAAGSLREPISKPEPAAGSGLKIISKPVPAQAPCGLPV